MTVTVPSSFDPTSNSDMINTASSSSADTENVKVYSNITITIIDIFLILPYII